MKKILFLIFLACCVFSCKKEHPEPYPTAPTAPVVVNPPASNNPVVAVSISVDQTHPGYPISPVFEGLSYETAILTKDPGVLSAGNKVLVQLIRNLGAGMLRVGGDTSDETEWTGTARSAATPDNVLTTSDIDRLAAFAKATGWPVLFGLNLGNNNAAAAASEAQYASKSLGSKLYSLQFGNEPDVYHLYALRTPDYGIVNYKQDWENYFSAIQALVPEAAFSGPDNSYNTDYADAFADSENKKARLVDAHYYLTGPASNPSITYKNLLAPNYWLNTYMQKIGYAALRNNLQYRITETNNVYGGGKQGVSDVFASALWALDLMWTIAEHNGQGINFHGGSGLFYSPITNDNGIITARPEYYAMLAFKYGSDNATIIPVITGTLQYSYSAYAANCGDNTSTITLINKEEKTDISFTVQVSKTVASVQVTRLMAPEIVSTTGTTFAGSSVNADGSFTPTAIEQPKVNDKSFVVRVLAGSAVVITVR